MTHIILTIKNLRPISVEKLEKSNHLIEPCHSKHKMSLGYESERRLKELLVAVGDGERGLEAARQRLCNIRDFAPHSAFQRFDRDCNAFVSSLEVLNFLRDQRNFTVQESETFRLVKFFDSDEDGRLSFQE